MSQYSEKDLRDAAEFRDGVHREALRKLQRVEPSITSVFDRYPVEAYFQQYWDYPGQWYTIVAIPEASRSREALVETIVRDTLSRYRRGDKSLAQPRKETAAAQPKTAEKALSGAFSCPDDPFYALLAEYPDLAVDYCIVKCAPLPCRGSSSHRLALAHAFRKLSADAGDGQGWQYDVDRARGTPIDAAELFSSRYQTDRLNYRKAFLYPPHENSYTGADFVRVNAALFPKGTDGLQVYAWTTDWSDYFDEGREWWGTLCLTVYDKKLDRFVVILASATD